MLEKLRELSESDRQNSFEDVLPEADIPDSYPSELKALYLAFGCPYLTQGLSDQDVGNPPDYFVEVLPPKEIEKLIANKSDNLMPYPEGFGGHIPFAHVGNNLFLCVGNNNAVYNVGLKKAGDSLASFMDELAVKITRYMD
jgi:hypothetical protein